MRLSNEPVDPARETAHAHADEMLDLGDRVLRMLAEGYDGKQITAGYGVTADQAKAALNRYVDRVFGVDEIPPAPSPECSISEYNGWCFVHGCFHTHGGGVMSSWPADAA